MSRPAGKVAYALNFYRCFVAKFDSHCYVLVVYAPFAIGHCGYPIVNWNFGVAASYVRREFGDGCRAQLWTQPSIEQSVVEGLKVLVWILPCAVTSVLTCGKGTVEFHVHLSDVKSIQRTLAQFYFFGALVWQFLYRVRRALKFLVGLTGDVDPN